MAVTPNFSWPTPDDSDAVSQGAAAMRSLGTAIDVTVYGQGTAITGLQSDLSSLTTTDVSEGTNLYYTNTRADARIAAADLEDLANVGGSPTDGQLLAYGTATSTWNPTDQLAGIGTNAAQTLFTSSFSTASPTYVNVTGFSVTITPTSASSKILVMMSTDFANSGASGANRLQIVRGGSTRIGAKDDYIANVYHGSHLAGASGNSSMHYSISILDSPATTSAVTYQVRAKCSGGTMRVNARTDGAAARMAHITAIEVAA